MPTPLTPLAPRAPATGRAVPGAAVRLPASSQWATTTPSRIAPEGYSWLQAVHWHHDHAQVAHDRSHGPTRLNRTTLRLAGILARLTECRPGVDQLVMWLKISERTVQYHLSLLRDAGLLVYLSKGTRVSGIGGRASEFLRTIPPTFDEALGLRTGPSERYIRSVRGMAEDQVPVMKALAAKAKRTLSNARTKGANRRALKATSAASSCTPRGVSTSRLSSAGMTSLPPESKLGAGNHTSPTPQKPAAPRRKLNQTGRRHQLAFELIQQVGWLNRADVPRIAWIVRHVADAGWTAADVMAVLAQQSPAQRVHRPSGFLASRLRGVEQVYDTPAKRANLVTWWRDSRRAEQDRHDDWAGAWQAPTDRSLVRRVDAVFADVRQAAAGVLVPYGEIAADDDASADLEQLTPEEITSLRAAAQQDPTFIRITIDARGETYARRLFTHHLVDQARRLAGLGRTTLHRRRSA
ncbi:helix-turn-helix domain-containing protein [Streptomyces sp. H10-C2]|uniref:helix-turn-helix domain-containing protein n=1 Tax=unclassified Streptomyces TaxID=2593676 RepID=UPI0024BA1D29|nr:MULTISPECIES: helix-turn-helix domain-containing protein [unclassified Streptomyces]MDJ0342825.1 helix-turn-helix domain-containing protein [Streptomyces sp. PH10-H1]MDJ0372503.1 helix-turn-helix domain-containing protein [Streptomyces sp. H10-C2]